MTTFITVLQVLACFILITSVLFQQPKGGGSVFGGTSQSVFGSTGGTTFLFRLSMWSAIFIMLSSLVLAWYRNDEARSTVTDSYTPPAAATAPAVPVETAPAVPVAPATSTK